MQLIATHSEKKKIVDQPVTFKVIRPAHHSTKMEFGFRQKLIKWMMWMNILMVAMKKFGSPRVAFSKTKQLRKLRDQYRNYRPPLKYSFTGNKYFVSYNTPAWPSKAFNNYISHLLNRAMPASQPSLHTLIFAITKKCGFQCEHCCEWENLNKPEMLSRQDLLSIIRRFQELGVSQVQLSGGEPLNRFDDILFLLKNIREGTDFWLYTTGFQLTSEKAKLLKNHGLRGITISLDHHDPELHDQFRGRKGAYGRALQAAQFAVDADLAVCFSLCATRQFISMENLMKYAGIARNAGASFIQILEPKAVGHYAGHDVMLNEHQTQILEQFFDSLNYDKAFSTYPVVSYHGYYSRRIGCSGSGKDYLYVDTDGDVHSCPFCQRKLFSAFDEALPEKINGMKMRGCSVNNIFK